jgi:hypothetical protein
MPEFRSENKFICSQGQMEILRARLSPVLRPDEHQSGACYRIRSLYFDDDADTAFYDNDAGNDRRRKFRLRVYDRLDDGARLEIKHKARGGTKKDFCAMPKALCEAVLRGEPIPWDAGYPPALTELFRETQLNALRPRIIVEYERSAYVCAAGNVRITFDRNIAYSANTEAFLDDFLPLTPVLPKGVHLLEVKYDELIPDYIIQLLETGELTRTTFSKYYLACLAQKGEYIW